jgi:gluconate:H+ symporter, GntP family
MPFVDVACLALAIATIVVLAARRRLPLVLAVVCGAVVFAATAGLSVGHASKAFGTGFAQTVQAIGLAVVAGALIGAVAEGTGGLDRLSKTLGRMSVRTRLRLLGAIGVVAGAGSSPAVAFAVLAPLRRAFGGDAAPPAAVLGATMLAGHALLLPSPVVIAAMAVLGADWILMLTVGLPVAVVTAIVGASWAGATAPRSDAPAAVSNRIPGGVAARTAPALVLISLVLIALLLVQGFGDLPTEPLGGGGVRERLLGLGRPLTLLVVGVGLMLIVAWRWDEEALSERGWLGRGLAAAALPVLLVGAAGGLQTLNQQPGMAELLAERLLDLPWGLVLPFAVAATVKVLQGSSLVAALTASGMIVPLLGPLGLDTETGRVLAALAVGAGATCLSHVNDPHFWLVADGGAMRPASALRSLTGATLVQGLTALGGLYAAAAILG